MQQYVMNLYFGGGTTPIEGSFPTIIWKVKSTPPKSGGFSSEGGRIEKHVFSLKISRNNKLFGKILSKIQKRVFCRKLEK